MTNTSRELVHIGTFPAWQSCYELQSVFCLKDPILVLCSSGPLLCRNKIEEETKLRMAVILQQLQVAAKSLKSETHLPMIVVDGIIPGVVEQKAQAVLLRVFALYGPTEPTVRE